MSRTGRHLPRVHLYSDHLFVGERACFVDGAYGPYVRRPLEQDVHPHHRSHCARRSLAAAYRMVQSLERAEQLDLFACGNREALAEWRGIFVAVAREVRRTGRYYRPAGGPEFRQGASA